MEFKFGQLHHLEFYVQDLSKTLEFWDWFLKKLNYDVVGEFKGGISYGNFSGTYIVFVQLDSEGNLIHNNRQGPGLNHLAFSVAGTENLKTFQNELKDKNIRILKTNEEHVCFEEINKFAIELFA